MPKPKAQSPKPKEIKLSPWRKYQEHIKKNKMTPKNKMKVK